MTEVWLERADMGSQISVRCAGCRAALGPQHIHIHGERSPGWRCVCSEGCAIHFIKERGYTVVPKPAEVVS